MTGFHEIPFRSIQYGYLSTPSSFSGMVGEQTAVQREWSEHWIALKSVEAELRQKEEIIPMEEEKLRVLQERLRTWSYCGHVFALAICQPHDVIMLSVLFLRM